MRPHNLKTQMKTNEKKKKTICTVAGHSCCELEAFSSASGEQREHSREKTTQFEIECGRLEAKNIRECERDARKIKKIHAAIFDLQSDFKLVFTIFYNGDNVCVLVNYDECCRSASNATAVRTNLFTNMACELIMAKVNEN